MTAITKTWTHKFLRQSTDSSIDIPETAVKLMARIGKTEPDFISETWSGSVQIRIVDPFIIQKSITIPWPIVNYLGLFILLHELRHWEQFEPHEMNYWLNCPRWFLEIDAERAAIRWMEDRNIPIGRYHTQRMREGIQKVMEDYGNTPMKEQIYWGNMIPLQTVNIPQFDQSMKELLK